MANFPERSVIIGTICCGKTEFASNGEFYFVSLVLVVTTATTFNF